MGTPSLGEREFRDSAGPVNDGFRAIPLKKFSKCRGTPHIGLAFVSPPEDICEPGEWQNGDWTLVHPDYTVRFWGVRGSIACPGPDTVRYGGNTSCVEIRCGEHLMVFDGGTGLRLLGNEFVPPPPARRSRPVLQPHAFRPHLRIAVFCAVL